MAWFRRRKRPTASTGSEPPGGLAPVPALPAEFRADLDKFVNDSLPYGLDAYTPDFLDKLIEARRQKLEAETRISHMKATEKLMPGLILAHAERERRKVIYIAKQRYLSELAAGRDAAVRDLLGPEDTAEPPEPGGQPSEPQPAPIPGESEDRQ